MQERNHIEWRCSGRSSALWLHILLLFLESPELRLNGHGGLLRLRVVHIDVEVLGEVVLVLLIFRGESGVRILRTVIVVCQYPYVSNPVLAISEEVGRIVQVAAQSQGPHNFLRSNSHRQFWLSNQAQTQTPRLPIGCPIFTSIIQYNIIPVIKIYMLTCYIKKENMILPLSFSFHFPALAS